MTPDFKEVPQRLAALHQRIGAACARAGRPRESVVLLAVGKAQPAAALAAAADAGQRDFAENYVQEALPKIAALAGRGLRWHFIGPLQANKTADVAAHFDWVHGVDREKVARRLSDQRPAGLPPLDVCVQVNISGEASKSGAAPQQAEALCRAVAALPRLRLRGLMAIPAPPKKGDSPLFHEDGKGDSPRHAYRRLRELRDALNRAGLELDTLSAGMSDDFEAAIAEGATMVRIGTALFGRRG
jgi:pyridoxal phosphate enzyme (YggS family)